MAYLSSIHCNHYNFHPSEDLTVRRPCVALSFAANFSVSFDFLRAANPLAILGATPCALGFFTFVINSRRRGGVPPVLKSSCKITWGFVTHSQLKARLWCQFFSMFIHIWGTDPIWLIFFFTWIEKPPTRKSNENIKTQFEYKTLLRILRIWRTFPPPPPPPPPKEIKHGL